MKTLPVGLSFCAFKMLSLKTFCFLQVRRLLLFLQDAEIRSYVGCCVPEAPTGKANSGMERDKQGTRKILCVCVMERKKERKGEGRERALLHELV